MTSLSPIAELAALNHADSVVRIPDQTDVPLTPRVKRIIDTSAFRRLASVRQLGFVSLVYPGAVHNRMEHSLGVYRNTLLYLQQLCRDSQFESVMDEATLDAMILGALVHDLGHYPYCHPVEDIGLAEVRQHEELARESLESDSFRELIEQDWRCDLELVMRLLNKSVTSPAERIANSILSGPIDVDKLDYLFRDSLHAGVPYGRNFDSPRLIKSLCLDRSGSAIGITTKGRTAAELMVFARYVMFSEVYWHHAVRSATAMFQRLFFEVHDQLRLERIYSSTDATFAAELQRVAVTEPFWLELFLDLFGTSRQLYKRWGQFSSFSSPELFGLIARKPYGWLVACAEQLSWCLSQRLGQTTPATYVLIDAPPVGLEVQFEIDVKEQKTGQYFSLGELSPVVKSLAERQFDDYVKQVRVFVHPELRPQVEHLDLATLLHEAAGQVKWPIA